MSKNKVHSACVTASTTRVNVESTQKIYAASSNPTSSCRLCKSVENSARHNSAFLYLLKFPDPVSNVEGIMVGMIKLHYAIEKGLSKVALRETRSVLEICFARQTITPESLLLAEFSDEIRLVFRAMYSPVFIVAKNVFTVLSVHWSPLTFLVTISISTNFNQIIGVRAISCPERVGRWAIFAKTVEKKRG